MPYITSQDRAHIDAGQLPNTPGELNYVITMAIWDYYRRHLPPNAHGSYALGNEIVGVLGCAQAEFYRRVLAPYEDQKRQENGDVYTY